jgi:two-component system response regulator HydG
VTGRILIVDDDPSMGQMLVAALKRKKFEPAYVGSGDEALNVLAEHEFDVVVTDVRMRGMNGLELCRRVAAERRDVPVVVITAFGSLETAIEAIRAGAYDFITKPFEPDVLALTLTRAVQHKALREEVKQLRAAAAAAEREGHVVGSSPAVRAMDDLLDRVVESDATVLITGESGTGKEVIARTIHARSKRAGNAFVAINCSAVPDTLLESELFGHVKGAFTDARAARRGLFLQADGGTLFLDEVGEMPMPVQVKLLRALQERTVRPVGGDDEQPFNVRVVAATNRDLETAIEERRFREDLYYRLNVLHVGVPPLRERGSDVLLLAQHFLDRFARQSGKKVAAISAEAAGRLLQYVWPGNVRELQNAIERAVALARYEHLTVDDLPEKIRKYQRSHVVVASEDPGELVPLEEVERRYILRVMEAVGGNKTVAAQVLGLDRTTLYRKLERYGHGASAGGSGTGTGTGTGGAPPEGASS